MLINYYVLLVFAPLLILTGILGFVIPAKKSLTSGAPAYNIFHIISGLVGLSVLYFHPDIGIRTFNIGFGLIDLYQLVANKADLFPKRYFRWTKVDDILHLVIGAILVLVGIIGI